MALSRFVQGIHEDLWRYFMAVEIKNGKQTPMNPYGRKIPTINGRSKKWETWKYIALMEDKNSLKGDLTMDRFLKNIVKLWGGRPMKTRMTEGIHLGSPNNFSQRISPDWWLTKPLWKIWFRQLGWWHSQCMEKINGDTQVDVETPMWKPTVSID